MRWITQGLSVRTNQFNFNSPLNYVGYSGVGRQLLPDPPLWFLLRRLFEIYLRCRNYGCGSQ